MKINLVKIFSSVTDGYVLVIVEIHLYLKLFTLTGKKLSKVYVTTRLSAVGGIRTQTANKEHVLHQIVH